MINKKLSFKELFKELHQVEWISFYFFLSIIVNFSAWLMVLFFIVIPGIITPGSLDLNDLFIYILLTIIMSFICLFPTIRSNKKDNHIVFLTNSIIEAIIENVSDMDLIKDENEKTILEKNFKSLFVSEKIHDYKYSMIMMGSIIEFLLVRYCNNNIIDLEPYINPNGNITPANKKHFCNYIQSAIKYDILGQKNSWYLIQNNLRNFRNYVHISKEVKEEPIDYDWYLATKSVFDRIIRNFKPTTEKV
ncbi:MAG: hypothetical protein ACFE8C_10200 [Promethearchaeota archaeon]